MSIRKSIHLDDDDDNNKKVNIYEGKFKILIIIKNQGFFRFVSWSRELKNTLATVMK